MEYSMVWVRGHIEVYDGAGRFCFSADNEREAWEELEGAACPSLPSHRSTPVLARTPQSKGWRTFRISGR